MGAPDVPWRRPAALAVGAGLPLVEALLLVAAGRHDSLGPAPQASALAPYAVLHDLRWLMVFAWSPWSVGLALAGLVAARATIQTALVAAVWPRERPRPPTRLLAMRSAQLVVICLAVLWPAATLAFGAGATGLATLLYLGLALVLLLAPLLVHGAATGTWWRRLPAARAVGRAYASFAVLSLAAAGMELAPVVLAPVVAVAAGVFNAWAWSGIVAVDAAGREPARRFPANAAAVLSVYGAVLILVAVAFRSGPSHSGPHRPPPAIGPSARGRTPVLLVSGYGSSYDGTLDIAFDDRYLTWRFSYAGLGPDGRPRPYRAESTYRSLDTSIDRLAAQVEAMHHRTGRQVVIVASSEGSVVARSYIGLTPRAPVGHLLMLSPLVRPDQVYWPGPSGAGRGDLARWAIDAVGVLADRLTAFRVDPDLPFLRSMLALSLIHI